MCDTLIALPPATASGTLIFGKNSDRPHDEAQSIVRFPRATHASDAMVRCTYIEIPQVAVTHAVLLSQPDWMWGAEMGANEHGVVMGNEAVWTREALGPPALLGMDLLRLGLERATTAREAVEVLAQLLGAHGQGGACAEGDPSLSYHNSFLVADGTEAWVLETAGSHWVAERVASGVRTISNELSIRASYDLCSAGLLAYATAQGWHTGDGPVDFAAAFSTAGASASEHSRAASGRQLLGRHDGAITPEIMMEVLRDHESGICMHGYFATTASMVSELGGESSAHWVTGASHPCQTPFRPA